MVWPSTEVEEEFVHERLYSIALITPPELSTQHLPVCYQYISRTLQAQILKTTSLINLDLHVPVCKIFHSYHIRNNFVPRSQCWRFVVNPLQQYVTYIALIHRSLYSVFLSLIAAEKIKSLSDPYRSQCWHLNADSIPNRAQLYLCETTLLHQHKKKYLKVTESIFGKMRLV